MLHLGQPSLPIAPVMGIDRDLVMKRVFCAPVDQVWTAWTEAACLARWWGPDECVNTVRALDLRPGGAWHIDMRLANGLTYPLKSILREVVPGERLVLLMDVSSHPASWHARLDGFRGRPATGPDRIIRTAVTMDGADGATALTIHQRFSTIEERDAYVQMGARNGWGQSLDRLEELLIHP